MKTFKSFLNSFLNCTLFSFLIITKILNVKGDDCQILENAFNILKENDVDNFYNKDNPIINQGFKNCCQNQGIKCENNYITEIKMENYNFAFMNINGFLNELSNLVNLHSLIINNSRNIDSIPDSIGKLRNLKILELTENMILGNIPEWISNLENLIDLNLSNNLLSGVIPYNFKYLEHIEQLNLSGNNRLEGYVPLMPNIKICNYEETSLCNLKGSKCKSNNSICTNSDIKITNSKNGIPDRNSDEFKDESKDDTNDGEDDKNSKGNLNLFNSPLGAVILISIIAVIVVILIMIISLKYGEGVGGEDYEVSPEERARARARNERQKEKTRAVARGNLKKYVRM